MRIRRLTLLLLCASVLPGCALRQMQQQQDAALADAQRTAALAHNQRPTVQWHDGAWLMGQETTASKPQPAIYDKPVDYTYRGGSIVDLARWIRMATGVQVVIDPSVYDAKSAHPGTSVASSRGPTVLPPLPAAVPSLPGLNTPLPSGSADAASPPQSSAASGRWQHYVTTLGGLLKQEDARFGVWDKYQDGTLTFFRTETRYFQLPSIDDSASFDSTISTSSGGSDSGGSGAGSNTAPSSSTSGSGSGGAGGNVQNSVLHVDVQPFKQIQQTATAIAGGAKVVADTNLGMLVVTGTPPQCDAVAAFMKSLSATFGKVISFDVHLYSVQISREENYGANIGLAYKSATGHSSASIVGAAAPAISGSGTGLTFGASVLTGPFAGTKGTLQLLSTLGKVVGEQSLPGSTVNGKKFTVQMGQTQPYLPSVQSTLAANVGSATSAQGAFVPLGFAAQVLPKLAYGAINMDITVTVKRLISMVTLPPGCTPSTSNQSCLTMPFTSDLGLQAVNTLKPGETLLLVGLSDNQSSSQNNGVGSPNMPLFGGGVDANQTKNLFVVAVTARVL